MKYEIIKKETKNVFPEKGEEIVKYNISIPYIESKDKFGKVFNGFYSMMQKRYEEFAKNKLYKEALRYKALSKESFQPFGAVLRFICSYFNGNIISIVTDAFVSLGEEKREVKRLSQNWDVKKCRLLVFDDFFDSSEKNNILTGIKNEAKIRHDTGMTTFCEDFEKKLKREFSKNDFYLTPKGYGFFYPAGCLSKEEYGEVFFLLGYKGNGECNPY